MSNQFLLTTLIILSIFSSSSACDPRDLAALLAIKNSFPAGSFPSSWNSSINCCFWDYIQCDDDTTGRVIRLSISDNKNLSGSLPPAIGDLSALQIIYFSNLPNLVGPLPSQFSKLTSLQFLTFYETKLSGAIPSYLSTFTGLKEINIINGNFVGTIPASLGSLVNLSTLDLSGNDLTGSIPDSLFSSLKGSLVDLDLSDNTLTGPIPESFGNVAFTNINLGSNQFTGDASFLFGENKPVLAISLGRNKLAFDLTNVTYPLNLQTLDLSHNQIYGSISNQITELPNLRSFDVSYNMLCGKIPYGGYFTQVDASAFANNKCLCGTPLPPCS